VSNSLLKTPKKKASTSNSATTAIKNMKGKSRTDTDSASVASANSNNSESSISIILSKIHKKKKHSSTNSVSDDTKQDSNSVTSVVKVSKIVRTPSIGSTSVPVSITSSPDAFKSPTQKNDRNIITAGDKRIASFLNGSPSAKIGNSISATKPAPPNLAAFGIRPSKSPPHFGGKTLNSSSKDSTMRVAVIKGVKSETAAIVMRCEPVSGMANNSNASWSEKLFADALGSPTKQTERWVLDLFISLITYPWHHINIRQMNNKGFPIRLFVMYTDGVPSEDSVYKFCQTVCYYLNATLNNTTKITVDPKTMFWLGENAKWSDVVGDKQSCDMLTFGKGEPNPGFYEEHKDEILTHFHDGTFSENLASYFHAPDSTLHPSVIRDREESQFNNTDGEQTEKE
jgi:hypothetical protein